MTRIVRTWDVLRWSLLNPWDMKSVGVLKATYGTDVRRRTGAFAWESVCAGLELSLVNGYVRNVCF